MKRRRLPMDRSWLAVAALMLMLVLTGAMILIGNFNAILDSTFLCGPPSRDLEIDKVPVQLHAILHYATTTDMPQQSPKEIRATFDVLFSSYPCNFLVFGVGHELMWSSLNPNGFTMFLEDDPDWVEIVRAKSPKMRVHGVKYDTHLYEAKDLMGHYRLEPYCLLPKVYLRGNKNCRLILHDLPDEVYKREWDVIMIDGPGGYEPDLPGRMAVIFTVAVMARLRKGPGVTHVMLHDVNRRVEKIYGERFLCKKRMVKHVDNLWHFVIPPATQAEINMGKTFFC